MSNQNSFQTHHFSEISPIIIKNPTIECFTLSEQIERNEGNRISYHLTCNLEKVLVIWESKKFYALYQLNTEIFVEEQWQNALIQIFSQLTELGDIYYQFQYHLVDNISPYILAKFATQALSRKYLSKTDVYSNNKVKVIRKAEYWAETIDLKEKGHPAIALTINSQISYQGNLLTYYNYQQDKTESNFIGIEVKNLGFDNSGNGKIVGFRGLIKDRRQELLRKPNITVKSKEALEQASENQPIVAVKFGKNQKEYHFALAALSPAVTRETALKFGVDWGILLKKSKIKHSDRQKLLTVYKNEIKSILKQYNITVEKNINTFKYPDSFIQLPSLDEIELLFGKNYITTATSILSGLRRGGVYKRHKIYQDEYRIIRLSVFTVIDNKSFSIPIQPVKQRLLDYGFDSELINNCTVDISRLTDIQARIKVEQELAKFLALPTDIILVALPTRDQKNKDELSLYNRIYSTALRRRIPTQFIYENTILLNRSEKDLRNVLNQFIPGILAKLGNIPYVLKEPLTLADYYIGFDVARLPKAKNLGSMNACASIRIYGRHGEFMRKVIPTVFDQGIEGVVVRPIRITPGRTKIGRCYI